MRHRKSGRKRNRFRLTLAITILAFVALVFPAAGGAWHGPGIWHWGYNYIGPNLNNPVQSGFNYWYDQYVDKQNGGELYVGWSTGYYPCQVPLYGPASIYHHPTRCGWGGWYIRNFLNVDNPNANMSYTYADSVA